MFKISSIQSGCMLNLIVNMNIYIDGKIWGDVEFKGTSSVDRIGLLVGTQGSGHL